MKGPRPSIPFETRIPKPPLFVEAPGFAEDWNGLGYDDNDLALLQRQLTSRPTGPPVVPGTGGLRKSRFVSPRQRQGKRGATRVGYVYFERYELVYLVIAYAKTAQRDILQDQKKMIRQMITIYERKLAHQPELRDEGQEQKKR